MSLLFLTSLCWCAALAENGGAFVGLGNNNSLIHPPQNGQVLIDLMEELNIESGSWVAISSNAGALAAAELSVDSPSDAVVAPPGPQAKFRLLHVGDGRIALQHARGQFLSPVHPDAAHWTFRSNRQVWETLHVEVRAWEYGGAFATRVRLFAVIDQRILYCAPPVDGSSRVRIVRDPGHDWLQGHEGEWSLALADVPSINLAPFGDLGPLGDAATLADLASPLDRLPRMILRALKEVGMFFVHGHGISDALFQSLVAVTGELPWAEGANVEKNSLARQERGQQVVPEWPGLPFVAPLARQYLEAMRTLSSSILHAMALAQAGALGADHHAHNWRRAWEDEHDMLG